MKNIIFLLIALLSLPILAKEEQIQFPPVPTWKPDFSVSVESVLDRIKYYSNNKRDIIMFENGTSVVLPHNLSDSDARAYALEVLSKIYKFHPDMNPIKMDDGNILVKYNHPAFNVVINDFANKHLKAIKKRHLDGLATSEVLITPLGNNVFDEFGMKSIYGRTFMFMDAQNPKIVKLYRHKSPNK
jgi:hypothetical protein